MSNSAEKLAAAQDLWDTYRSIYARKGLDIASRCTEWARRKRHSLEKYTAGNSFDELCRDGCQPLPLAIVMATVQPLRSFEKNWRQITGSTRQREQRIRTIERAATVLEDLQETIANVLIEETDSSMDRGSREAFRQKIINPSDFERTSATDLGLRHPAAMISDLRLCASVLEIIQSWEKETNVTSSDMLAKYLMSAYVYRATNRFHDEEVSALIGNALDVDYDETAHRMWRNRNYKRIDKTLSNIADLLTYFGEVSVT